MARKPKKGYFVKGQFVAEGSEEDLALKREAKGSEGTSKTDLKRESAELQKLGEDLLGLRSALMQRLTSQGHVDEKLSDALVHARQITNFEGRRRQMQFIGTKSLRIRVYSKCCLKLSTRKAQCLEH